MKIKTKIIYCKNHSTELSSFCFLKIGFEIKKCKIENIMSKKSFFIFIDFIVIDWILISFNIQNVNEK